MLSLFRARKLKLAEVEGIDNLPVGTLRELYNYWRLKKKNRSMPARADLKPEELCAQLPHVMLIDVEAKPLRYKYRLIGTEIVKLLGRDLTGTYLDETSKTSLYLKRLNWLIKKKKAYYSMSNLDWLGRHFQRYHVLGLPLGNQQGGVEMILCGIEPIY